MEWTPSGLIDEGFMGFVRFEDLPTEDVPRTSGVYVVVRPWNTAPDFLAASPAGWFKSKDPSVTIDVLLEAWIAESPVLYIGKANRGKNGRRGLRKRLDEYRRHGAGEPVGHWGGRRIWQLSDSQELLVAWRPTPDGEARPLERDMIAEFKARYSARPFANLTG